MLHYVDHSNEVEPVKNEEEEDHVQNDEHDVAKENSAQDVVNMDIFALLNSKTNHNDEISTQDTVKAGHRLEKFDYLNGKKENQIFLD